MDNRAEEAKAPEGGHGIATGTYSLYKHMHMVELGYEVGGMDAAARFSVGVMCGLGVV